MMISMNYPANLEEENKSLSYLTIFSPSDSENVDISHNIWRTSCLTTKFWSNLTRISYKNRIAFACLLQLRCNNGKLMQFCFYTRSSSDLIRNSFRPTVSINFFNNISREVKTVSPVGSTVFTSLKMLFFKTLVNHDNLQMLCNKNF